MVNTEPSFWENFLCLSNNIISDPQIRLQTVVAIYTLYYSVLDLDSLIPLLGWDFGFHREPPDDPVSESES
jgi:hypothetical protein